MESITTQCFIGAQAYAGLDSPNFLKLHLVLKEKMTTWFQSSISIENMGFELEQCDTFIIRGALK